MCEKRVVPHKSESPPPPLLPCSAEPPCSTVLDAECFGTWWCEHLAKEWGWLSVPCVSGWGLPNARPCPHGGIELWGVGGKTLVDAAGI